MSRFRNLLTGIVVSVSDEKDARFADGWVSAEVPVEEPKRAPARTKKNYN